MASAAAHFATWGGEPTNTNQNYYGLHKFSRKRRNILSDRINSTRHIILPVIIAQSRLGRPTGGKRSGNRGDKAPVKIPEAPRRVDAANGHRFAPTILIDPDRSTTIGLPLASVPRTA